MGKSAFDLHHLWTLHGMEEGGTGRPLQDHGYVQAKKDATQRTLDARLRNCRFVAELTKFRICPYGTFFIMLKVHPLIPLLFGCELLV